MRTLHVGLRVEDLERSPGFCVTLGYEVVGTVPETEFGSLTMLKLPDDVFVSLELVRDPVAGPVHPAGLNHLVVQVDDLHATVARLSGNAIEAGAPSSPDGSDDFWTAWLTDPDGYRIELVQWPPGHADGLTRRLSRATPVHDNVRGVTGGGAWADQGSPLPRPSAHAAERGHWPEAGYDEFCAFGGCIDESGFAAGSVVATPGGGGTMGKVVASITTSVDGYITGPGDGPEYGLGQGGERLHYWVMGGPWTYEGGHDFAMHGPDKQFYDELVSTMASGVVGRGMYDAAGAWGGTNPFPGTLFVLTHRTADQPAAETGFRFVSDLDTALAQAAEAAGDGDVAVGGGADVIRQALAAGKVDELVISTAPVILGAGKRLFEGFDRDMDLEVAKVYSSPYATHVRYTVTK